MILDELLDKAPCGFLSFDDSGAITIANATLESMVGREPGSLVGSNLEKLLTVGARVFYQTHFFPLLKLHGSADEIYLTLRSGDGADIPVLVNAAGRQRDGKCAYDCAVFPVAQRGRFEDELLKAKKVAEDAARARDNFLAVVSHELRTPLNAVLGWVEILRLAEGDVQLLEEGLQTIERNAKAQVRLIDDLIDVSRIVSGKLRMEVGVVDPRRVIESALDVVRPAADAKNIQIHRMFDSDAGLISADSDRLQQVLWNLLSNAVKFTPKGGSVEVRVQSAGSHVQIAVKDNGQGISAEFLPYVFERFRQAEGASTRRQGGLGLGMAITKDIVELHGGSIRALSEGEGRGATFIVSLPLTPAKGELQKGAAPSAQHSLKDQLPDLRGIRVLLVDDSPEARDAFAAMIVRCGAEVTPAASAAEAFEQIQKVQPAVLVSDIDMPGEDGLSLMRRIRSSKSPAAVTPAVALTGNARYADRMNALAAGFQVHISKPVEADELIIAIGNLCNRLASGQVENCC